MTTPAHLDALEAALLRAPCGGNGFELVRFPDCISSDDDAGASRAPAGLYPYQRTGFELLRDAEPKNLLVASPTGSGKTKLIEECVALARSRGQRIFVAEPLIALVEQIYQRLGGPGASDLCMLTGPSRKGDSSTAGVVVCTYEVLARLAACEPERLDGCPRIVLDEFHFLGSDRGSVLQEILGHAAHRSVVALSGTMPNVADLAAFLSRLNGFPTYVIGAQRRPVEISFYSYACASDRMAPLLPPPRPVGFRSQAIGGIKDRQGLLRFLAHLELHDCHPSLLVDFSCRRLDEMADWAASAAAAQDRTARRIVAGAFSKLLRKIPAEDHSLFALYRYWADRGIGVHHSHAPPPYLELVSWLAERRVLKLVFSSSTLSAGINLPVRTMCLLSARLPRRSGPDGDLAQGDIDPLLFHQLVGRAGRPGFETVGNCIVLVKQEADRASAQGLMQLSLPPVVPPSGFAAGDVLRALRDRRCLLSEVQALSCPVEHALSLRSTYDARLEAEALACLGLEDRKLLLQQVEAAHQVLSAPAALLSFARPVAPAMELALQRDGGIALRAPERAGGATDDRVLPLTLARKAQARKMPFEDVGSILEVQRAIRILLAGGSHFSRLRSICFRCRASQRALLASPLQDEFQRRSRALEGSALRCGVLTPLGMAACELRTCREPHLVLQRLLASGELDSTQALAFASQVLQEGGRARARGAGTAARDDEAVIETPAQSVCLVEAAAVLQTLTSTLSGFEGSNIDWTVAVLSWSYGSSLAELQELLPVGSFCRHVTRVADCCRELAVALAQLGASPKAFEAAYQSIARGLPFIRRGGWKEAAVDDVDEADDGLEARRAAAALPDFDVLFGEAPTDALQLGPA